MLLMAVSAMSSGSISAIREAERDPRGVGACARREGCPTRSRERARTAQQPTPGRVAPGARQAIRTRGALAGRRVKT